MAGFRDHLIQNPLMPLMHPIEIADGGHAAAMPVAQIVNAANQSHLILVSKDARLYRLVDGFVCARGSDRRES